MIWSLFLYGNHKNWLVKILGQIMDFNYGMNKMSFGQNASWMTVS